MRTRYTLSERIASAVLALAVGPMFACSSGGGGVVVTGLTAAFTTSGTAPAANTVRLRGGGMSGDMVTVEVAISGPTTDDDLYSFVFDLLVSDPSVARYVNSTEVFGSALTMGSGQGQAILVSQQGDRVVVGVSKTGGGPDSGNAVGSSEEVILSLAFRVLKPGATDVTIVGSPTNPQNPTPEPAALDSAGAVVDSVTFDPARATISGS